MEKREKFQFLLTRPRKKKESINSIWKTKTIVLLEEN